MFSWNFHLRSFDMKFALEHGSYIFCTLMHWICPKIYFQDFMNFALERLLDDICTRVFKLQFALIFSISWYIPYLSSAMHFALTYFIVIFLRMWDHVICTNVFHFKFPTLFCWCNLPYMVHEICTKTIQPFNLP